MEPTFSNRNRQAAAPIAASAIDNESSRTGPAGSRGLQISTQTDEVPGVRLEASGPRATVQGESLLPRNERAGLRTTSSSLRKRRPPVEAVDASVQRHRVHIAYRHSDLEPVRSQEQDASGGIGGVSPSSSRGTEDRSLGGGGERALGGLFGEDVHERGGGNAGHRSLSLESGFRMPAAIENGMGAAWNDGPFGASSACPSSPRVFQIGMAMDTGYFKVLAPLVAPQ